ncbi:MAG: GNAT family N-acetyltransferase [Promethearchaeota archaeon]
MPRLRDPSERASVKLRRLLFRNSKVTEEIAEKNETRKKHKFLVMKMSWDQALDVMKRLEKEMKEENGVILKKVRIRELQLDKDAEMFVRCYNRAFITAPDPYRSLTLQDVQHFKESTFVAELYGQIVGFIFLVIEPLIKQGIHLDRQGVIAGIGVDPRYRRKGIAFLLAARAAKYFEENNVMELICEVYHENKVSYNFIRNFGFSQTGIIFL